MPTSGYAHNSHGSSSLADIYDGVKIITSPQTDISFDSGVELEASQDKNITYYDDDRVRNCITL